MIRGAPGIGKSALLDRVAEGAAPARCLRASGVESELELPFAVLHQLLGPVLDGLDALPPVQADALRGALGLGPARGADRFLVAVALLGLLAETASHHGLVVLVDDLQWADVASVDALGFVARRLQVEGVAVVCAVRDLATAGLPGVPELVLGPLDPASSGAVLDEHAPGTAVAVRAALLDAADGNPLALIALPAALTTAQLAGHEPLPRPLPVRTDVEQVFAAVTARLPDPTRLLLTVAAADDTGRLAVVGRAAAALGGDLTVLGEAEAAGLVRIAEGTLAFQHPLVRSAVYQRAPFATRQAAHRVLAAVLDADDDRDRRAWHLAAAADAPDNAVAAALEESAARARARSGPAAAAAALHRAAALTAAPGERGRRLVAAAEASWSAGRPAQTVAQLDVAEPLLQEPAERGVALGLRGLVELSGGDPDTAYPLLVEAAAAADDPQDALSRLALAGEAASLSGDRRRTVELGRLAGDLNTTAPGSGLVADMLLGTAAAATDDWDQGAERLRRVIRGAEQEDEPLTLLRAGQAALLLGDEDSARRCYTRAVGVLRRTGGIGLLATTLDRLAFADTQCGRLDDAASECSEGLELARALGQQEATALSVLALVEAWRGAADDVRRHAHAAIALAARQRLGAVTAGASWALGLLDLGLGRWDDACARLGRVVAGGEPGHPGVALWATPDLVEAAARAGHPEAARPALRRFGAWAQRVGAPWALAAAHRGAAQLGGDGADAFRRAVELHDAARPLDRARTQLAHGERLRRSRRRADARIALRAALETFERVGAVPWAERARAELRATGETPGRRGPAARDALTPQETRIARLAAAGTSNPEIAAQLFLSRRTVEYHLHKVFTKLGVTGRVDLVRLDMDDGERFGTR